MYHKFAAYKFFFEKEIIYSTVKNYQVFWNIFIGNFGKSKFLQN